MIYRASIAVMLAYVVMGSAYLSGRILYMFLSTILPAR